MAEWRKFAAKQKAKRRVVEESKVAEEIVVQRMSGDVSVGVGQTGQNLQ